MPRYIDDIIINNKSITNHHQHHLHLSIINKVEFGVKVLKQVE
jgi:hypothetical protein